METNAWHSVLFVCLPKQSKAFPINRGIYVLLRLKNGIEISSVALNKPDGLNVFRSVYAQTFLIAWGDWFEIFWCPGWSTCYLTFSSLWEQTKFTVSRQKVLDNALLCNFRPTLLNNLLYRKMRHNLCVTIFFIFNLLLNRSLVWSCSWDCRARRLSLRDEPKSNFRQTRYFSVDLVSKKHLFVAYLRLIASCLIKMSLNFTTKLYQEFVKSRT